MVLNLVRKLTGSSGRKPTLRYFDEAYYLREYPEVSEHELSPLEHFLRNCSPPLRGCRGENGVGMVARGRQGLGFVIPGFDDS